MRYVISKKRMCLVVFPIPFDPVYKARHSCIDSRIARFSTSDSPGYNTHLIHHTSLNYHQRSSGVTLQHTHTHKHVCSYRCRQWLLWPGTTMMIRHQYNSSVCLRDNWSGMPALMWSFVTLSPSGLF